MPLRYPPPLLHRRPRGTVRVKDLRQLAKHLHARTDEVANAVEMIVRDEAQKAELRLKRAAGDSRTTGDSVQYRSGFLSDAARAVAHISKYSAQIELGFMGAGDVRTIGAARTHTGTAATSGRRSTLISARDAQKLAFPAPTAPEVIRTGVAGRSMTAMEASARFQLLTRKNVIWGRPLGQIHGAWKVFFIRRKRVRVPIRIRLADHLRILQRRINDRIGNLFG